MVSILTGSPYGAMKLGQRGIAFGYKQVAATRHKAKPRTYF